MGRHWFTPRRWLLALAILPLLALIVAPGVSAASITRAAATERPGEYDIRARGFDDDEHVSLRLIGPSGQEIKMGRKRASDRGRVHFTILIPRHVEPGRWTVVLRGAESDEDAEAVLQVPPRLPDALLSVGPVGGPTNASFTFLAARFRGGEVLTYWLDAPNGAVLEGGQVLVGAGGEASFAYTMTPAMPTGRWQVTAYGQSSDSMAVATFQYER
jgi:hypothetical protein